MQHWLIRMATTIFCFGIKPKQQAKVISLVYASYAAGMEFMLICYEAAKFGYVVSSCNEGGLEWNEVFDVSLLGLSAAFFWHYAS